MICLSPNPVPGAAYSYDPLSEIGAQFTVGSEGDPVQRLLERNRRVADTLLGAPPGDSYLVYDLVREEMKRHDIDLPILAPAYYHGIWTDADLMQVMVLEPEVAREHFRLATRRALAAIDDYVRLGIECIGIGGDFAGVRLLISPSAYREFIVPEVAACARRARAGGAWSVNASDGNLWPVLDDFLGGCEVDAYLEIDMSAGMDLARLKAAWGDRITFFGNMDCGRILSFSSPGRNPRRHPRHPRCGRGQGRPHLHGEQCHHGQRPACQLPRHGQRVQGEIRARAAELLKLRRGPDDRSVFSRCKARDLAQKYV